MEDKNPQILAFKPLNQHPPKDKTPEPMSQDEIDQAFAAAGGTPKTPPLPKKLGRPSSYRPEYCQELLKFFATPPFTLVPETWYNPDGSIKRETMKPHPNPPPHLSGFARHLGVSKHVLYTWAADYAEFADALAQARDMRREMVIGNSLLGLYNPVFAKVAAANWFNWHDRTDINHTGEVKSTIIRYHQPERLKAEDLQIE